MYIYVVLLAKLKETHKPSLSLFQWIFLMKLRFLGFYVFCLRLNCVLRFLRILCWRIWLLDGFRNWYCFTSLVCYVKKFTMSLWFSSRFYYVFLCFFTKILQCLRVFHQDSTLSLWFLPRLQCRCVFHQDSTMSLWFFTMILHCICDFLPRFYNVFSVVKNVWYL